MKRRVFKYSKLCRDKTIERQEAWGAVFHWKILNDAEYERELRIKLLEEAHEVNVAKNCDELIKELADLFEVIDALSKVYDLDKKDIMDMQIEIRNERGGFCNRLFIEKAEYLSGSKGEKYCLASPEKYPEIE